MDFIKLCIELILELLGLQRLNTGYRDTPPRKRKPIENKRLCICLHEWGGYPLSRHKHINDNICDWDCGIKYQLERFSNYTGNIDVKLNVTLSDAYRYKDMDYVAALCDKISSVPNRGMDFSGYSHSFRELQGGPNCYVLLTNSSVNAIQNEFIDSYVNYMESNPDVGMLGISCCSKCYQSLRQNNFTPHLQSFFLLTTLSVLEEIVALNSNKFPGEGIINKQLLIRRGEIKISQLALKLGYKLAVVTEHNVVKFDNNPANWTLPQGDYRIHTKNPNTINPLK